MYSYISFKSFLMELVKNMYIASLTEENNEYIHIVDNFYKQKKIMNVFIVISNMERENRIDSLSCMWNIMEQDGSMSLDSVNKTNSFFYLELHLLHLKQGSKGKTLKHNLCIVSSSYLNLLAMILIRCNNELQNFGSRTDTTFCGVFDGHGPYGHMAAKRVRNFLPMKLSEHWEDIRKSGNNSEIFHSVRETFLDVFELTDKELRDDPYFDCVCSGTTAVVLVKQVI